VPYRPGAQLSSVIHQTMSDSEDNSDSKRPRMKSFAKYYFLTVWAVGLVTFVVGEFNPTVRAFIFANFWWFFIAIASAIFSGPLLFPRGIAGLAQDLKEYQQRLSRRNKR